jgi:Family of unknown function (DUF6627)
MFRVISGCRSVYIGMAVLALLLALPLDHALAELVDTQSLKTDLCEDGIRERLFVILAREDVKIALIQLGINPLEVEARVSALTDEEVSQIHGRVGELPGGGMAPIVYPIWLVALMLLGYILVITGVIGGAAYAGTKLQEHQEEEYAKSIPYPAPPRVGPLPSVNPDEPWTGNWKVIEGPYKGVFRLKQDGDRVVSTEDSDHVLDAKVSGAMIWGKLGIKQDFKATIADDFLSFKGNVDNRYFFEGQKIDPTALKTEPTHTTPIEADKIKALLLRPRGWEVNWSGPGRAGEGVCLFETRGEKVVAKISIIDKPFPDRDCEREVIINSDVVKFDSCRHSGIVLQYDPSDQVYPFKGRSSEGVIYKLKAK